MLYMATAFDFNERLYGHEEAERHYRDYHVPLARSLPGLRGYAIGRLIATRSIPAERERGALLVFDDLAALRAAYHSPVGTALRADEDQLIAQPRVILIDGEVIV
jgi:uncharacterized protein (TIGR02118 family)